MELRSLLENRTQVGQLLILVMELIEDIGLAVLSIHDVIISDLKLTYSAYYISYFIYSDMSIAILIKRVKMLFDFTSFYNMNKE